MRKKPPATKSAETEATFPETSDTSEVSVRGSTVPCETTVKLSDRCSAAMVSTSTAGSPVSTRSGRCPREKLTSRATTTSAPTITATGKMDRMIFLNKPVFSVSRSSLAISLALPPAQNGQDYSDRLAIIPATCEMAVKFNHGCSVAMVSNCVGQRTPSTGYVAPMP